MKLSRRRLALATALVLLVLASAAAWVGYTALKARDHLQAVRSALPSVRQALLTGDGQGAAAGLSTVSQDAAAADRLTHDPVWRAAAALPVIGQPLDTVRGITSAVNALTSSTLPTLVTVADVVEPARLRPEPDRVDVGALAQVSGPLDVAAAELEDRTSTVRNLSPSWVGQIAQARADLLDQLEPLSRSTRRIATAASVVPGMLGHDGPRTYFLGFQNPAEARGTGGLLGAFAIVTADSGRVTVDRVGANTALPKPGRRLDGLDPAFVDRMDGQGALRLWVNSNLSPDFPEVARLWRSMWQSATGENVDGVLAVDPAVLAAVLRASGPVTVAEVGRVSADNVEQLVLQDQYRLTDVTVDRKDRMVGVGRAVIEAVLTGAADPRALIENVGATAREGHVLIYSTKQAEERVLVDAGLAGAVSATSGPFAQAVVVNAAGSKLDTYLRSATSYRVTRCSLTSRTAAVDVTLTNAAPRSGLPDYVVHRADDPEADTVRGQNRVQVQVILTRGAIVTGATLDGKRIALAPPVGDLPKTLDAGEAGVFLDEEQVGSHPAYTTVLEIAPGQQRTLQLLLDEPPSLQSALMPRQPLARQPILHSDVSACANV